MGMSNIFKKPDQRQILLDQAKVLRDEAGKVPHGEERSRMLTAARKIEAEANLDLGLVRRVFNHRPGDMMPLITRRWTDQDLKRLAELSAQGATVLRAAAALRRQSSSVVKMARLHGLPLVGTRHPRLLYEGLKRILHSADGGGHPRNAVIG